jgi:hypothetical protein
VIRTIVTFGVSTLAIAAAPKVAGSQSSRNDGPHLSQRQRVAMSKAIAVSDSGKFDICEAQRRFRAAMSQILTLRQRQEVIAAGMDPARRRRIEKLQEGAQASLRACHQTGSSCVDANRVVNVVALQSAFDASAIKRCSYRAVPTH